MWPPVPWSWPVLTLTRIRKIPTSPPIIPTPSWEWRIPGIFACYRKDLYLTKYMRYLLELLHEVRNLPAGRHGQTPGAEAQSLIGIPTELPQMLNAREQQAALQTSLLSSCPLSPGPPLP